MGNNAEGLVPEIDSIAQADGEMMDGRTPLDSGERAGTDRSLSASGSFSYAFLFFELNISDALSSNAFETRRNGSALGVAPLR